MKITHPRYTNFLFGHNSVQKYLSYVLHSDIIPPVWIFAGESGIGKTTCAYKFLKYVLSDIVPQTNTINSQHDFESQRSIDNINMIHNKIHPDLFEFFENEEDISIDYIRTQLSKLHSAPTYSTKKVILIHNFEKLNINIYNSLLKFLEESNTNTIIILITDNLSVIPYTILSRAIKLHFSKLDFDSTYNVLEQAEVKNSKDIAAICDGKPGYGVYLSQNNLIDTYKELFLALSQCIIGNISTAECFLSSQLKSKNSLDIKFFINSITRFFEIGLNSILKFPQEHTLEFETELYKILQNYNSSKRFATTAQRALNMLHNSQASALDLFSTLSIVFQYINQHMKEN